MKEIESNLLIVRVASGRRTARSTIKFEKEQTIVNVDDFRYEKS